MAGEYVRARLRERDNDLSAWLEEMRIQGHEEGDLVRAGLRLLMGKEAPTAGIFPQAVPKKHSPIVPRQTPSLERPKLALKEVNPAEEKGACIDALLGQF